MFGPANTELDSFLYSGAQQYNVVATIAGRVVPEKEIIAGGHHDSYSSNLLAAPGADDNASGTAAALEMARVLQAWGYMPASTLRFITFAAEEAGLRGSGDYSTRARAANREITAMLNFDMIGHRLSAQGDRDLYLVWYTGAETLARLDSQMTRHYTTLTPVLTTSYRSGSDSYRFWERGYPAVFSIERDFSPFYHSPQDISDTLDFEYAAEIVRAGLATVLYLDRESRPVAVPVPPVFSLAQNFPNPFNPGTSIRYSLATQERVTLTVYDMLGRQVAVLVAGEMSAGPHTARWDASDTASGIYVCRLTTGNRVETIKMVRMQ
jgi:Zn-dependent M28 family amino/carboxypeptidase